MAREYATKVYTVTTKFPRHEDHGLKSQMHRGVNSINLNIAEDIAKNSNKAFDHHLEIALGSVFEVVVASNLAMDRVYLNQGTNTKTYILAANDDFRRASMLSGTLLSVPIPRRIVHQYNLHRTCHRLLAHALRAFQVPAISYKPFTIGS